MHSQTPTFQVFISHTGENKDRIAIPLREKLQLLGITTFVDEKDITRGVEADQFMIDAMETADVAVVVLSPEFPLRKWPMMELLCFLRRRQQTLAEGKDKPFIIPFFYRLSISELYDEPRLDRRDSHGQLLHEKTRFKQRQENNEPEADIANIQGALRSLHRFEGVTNYNNATNDNTHDMEERRHDLLNKISDHVHILVDVNLRGKSVVGVNVVKERFSRHNYLDYDTSNLILNFEDKDEYGSPVTIEAKVLNAVLDNPSDGNGAIAIWGIAGVGKTSIASGIHCLHAVKQCFCDGVYYFALGADAKLYTVVGLLCKAVEDTGGKERSREMLKKKSWTLLVSIFRSWFEGKKCLFIVDDISENSEVTPAIVRDLLTLHTSGSGSKTLFTTKNVHTAVAAYHRFELKPREPFGHQSREMIMRYACVRLEAACNEDEEVFGAILEACGGLPLFLAISGKAVKSCSYLHGGQGVIAYHVYAEMLRENKWSLLQTPVDSYRRKLVTTLAVSLKLLDDRLRETTWQFELPLGAAEMYRRLSVLLKKSRVPMIVLQYLWELKNTSQTSIITREFEQFGLVDVEVRTKDGSRRALWLGIHDSLHEFASLETERHEEDSLGHSKLIGGFGEGLELGEGCRPWWLVQDEYMPDHITRHLFGAGMGDELICLMLQPLWSIATLEKSDILHLESDFNRAVLAASVTKTISGLRDRPTQTSVALKYISRAAKLCGVAGMDARVLCFQLYSRLLDLKAKYHAVQLYLSRVIRDAPRPWALPLVGFLETPSGPCVGICSVQEVPTCLEVVSEGVKYMVGCFDGNLNLLDVQGESVLSKWQAHSEVKSLGISGDRGKVWTWGSSKALSLSTSMKLWDVERQTKESEFDLPLAVGPVCVAVECIDVNPERQQVLCGYTDGRICLWEVQGKKKRWERLSAHEGYVRSVKLISDATSFFSGGNDGVIRKWTKEVPYATVELSGHALSVCCLAIAKNDRRIVSGSYDKTVHVWDHETGTSIACLKGHDGIVFNVNASEDCKRVVSGSADMTARVWNVETRSQIAVLRGHARPVLGVCLFSKGESVVSCSGDGTVRVWDVSLAQDSREQSTGQEDRHEGVVLSVAISGNGKVAVSGSTDKALRLWDTNSGKQLGDPFQGQGSQVSSVSMSHDGKRVCFASGSTFCVWDVGKEHRSISLPYECSAIGISPTGNRAIVAMAYMDDTNMCMRGTLRIWDLPRNLDNVPEVDNSTLAGDMNGYVLRSYISGDGKRAVCCSYEQVRVWDIETRCLLFEIARNRTQVAETTTNESVISRHDILHAVGESDRVPHLHCSGNRILWVDQGRTLVGLLDAPCSDYYYNEHRKVACIGTENGEVVFCKAIDSRQEEANETKRRNCVIS